jgi:hypothetical protein
MKRLLTVAAAAAMLAAVGCNGAGTSGGPGATNRDGVHVTQQENSFSLSPPMTGASLKQGEKTEVKIGIDRGKNFDQDVTLSFKDVPKGVTLSPGHPAIKHGDKDTMVSVEAAKDAAVGDFTVNIVGKPSKEGPEATQPFKLTVKKP